MGVPLFAEKLKAFMEYYVYLTVRFINEEGMKSAPSEVLGPRIVKTPAGSMFSVQLQLYSMLDQDSFLCAVLTFGDADRPLSDLGVLLL